MKDSDFIQQETQVRDTVGNRWIKCRFCGEIGRDDMFISYGGAGTLNMGTCRECAANNPDFIHWLQDFLLKSKWEVVSESDCPFMVQPPDKLSGSA